MEIKEWQCYDVLEAEDMKFKITALTWAAKNGHYKAVDALIQGGANVNTESSPLKVALWAMLTTSVDTSDVISVLLRNGADVNHTSIGPGEQTALSVAASGGFVDIVRQIIDVGTDISIVEILPPLLAASSCGETFALVFPGYTPPDPAVWGKIIIMLLDAGADVNVKGKDYMAFTPRTAASTSNCPQDVSNILEAAGGMLQELDEHGRLPELLGIHKA